MSSHSRQSNITQHFLSFYSLADVTPPPPSLHGLLGLNGGPMFSAYSASKHAVEGFTKVYTTIPTSRYISQTQSVYNASIHIDTHNQYTTTHKCPPPLFTQCLCQELKPWSIHVANINPGFMRTPMVVDSAKGTLKNFYDAPKEIQQQVCSLLTVQYIVFVCVFCIVTMPIYVILSNYLLCCYLLIV